MSITYSLKINVKSRVNTSLSSTDIISSLINAGWSVFSEEGNIIYTDINDIDDYNFLCKNISLDDYYEIARTKEKLNEVIAFAMFWCEDVKSYRIDVIIMPNFEILITPDDITKKLLNLDTKILDVNWYISKIIPCLTNGKMLIEEFSYSQY